MLTRTDRSLGVGSQSSFHMPKMEWSGMDLHIVHPFPSCDSSSMRCELGSAQPISYPQPTSARKAVPWHPEIRVSIKLYQCVPIPYPRISPYRSCAPNREDHADLECLHPHVLVVFVLSPPVAQDRSG